MRTDNASCRAPAEFIYSEDPRVITGAWIERCIVEESLQKPGVLLLDRPLPYEFPVPGQSQSACHFGPKLTLLSLQQAQRHSGYIRRTAQRWSSCTLSGLYAILVRRVNSLVSIAI